MSLSQSSTFLFAVLLGSYILCTAGEFSSGLESVLTRTAIEWDYSDGPNGPAHWGELSEDWASCSQGSSQSPADVDEEHIILDTFVDAPAKIYYHAAPATVRTDGKSLEVDWAGGIFNVHDYDFDLEKLVFHSPSEHTYFGERFPLEIQFYHTHPEQGVAINSLVFREGERNEWLEQLTSGLYEENLGKTVNLGVVGSRGVDGDALDWNRYYRYSGSLTTPPCTQKPTVTWSLLQAPLTASKDQISAVSASLLHQSNARPIQDMYTRLFHWPRSVDRLD